MRAHDCSNQLSFRGQTNITIIIIINVNKVEKLAHLQQVVLVEAGGAEGLPVDGLHHRQGVALGHVAPGPLVGHRRKPEGLPLEVGGFLFVRCIAVRSSVRSLYCRPAGVR